jgi:hypothetical protein
LPAPTPRVFVGVLTLRSVVGVSSMPNKFTIHQNTGGRPAGIEGTAVWRWRIQNMGIQAALYGAQVSPKSQAVKAGSASCCMQVYEKLTRSKVLP